MNITHAKHHKLETFARIGIAAKGVVYCLIGGLAVLAAIGSGGQTTGKAGAFKAVLEQPHGQILLGLIALGLLGYVAWRWIQAIKDTENKGSDTKGILTRIGYAISGIVYAALAFYAAKLIISGPGTGGSGSGGSSRSFFVDKLLEQPFGQWLVGIVAVIIIGKGIKQIYRALSNKFKEDIQNSDVDRKVQEYYEKAGKLGLIARGIVLGIIGYFFIKAALESNASQAQGTDGVFSFLSSTGGPYLMGAIALGLFLYGVFMFVKARYYSVKV